ncbi:MAG TPA: apolipoprotein N-acyltransferase, partial [Verrucomicrobiae bacterium]|nr:apolipoprotein N-acyltransferase [Verrucomicrobiae bacterium]
MTGGRTGIRLRGTAAALLGAAALAAAFPNTNATWLAPFGAAAIFWAWQGLSWRSAAVTGWLAGLVFFGMDYAWVGYTVSHYVGVFGPFIPLGIGLIEAPFLALAGVLCAIAYKYVTPALAPAGAAAAFTICEWLRSVGVLGAPFDQLGYTQADGPLRAIAAFAGTYGITLAICVLGAYIADALHRRTWRPLAIAAGATLAAALGCWIAWPARVLPPATIRVAAVQGNIAQSLKWDNLSLAVDRYTAMTHQAMLERPRLIVWPETVITTVLSERPELIWKFGQLAREAGATIVVGALDFDRDGMHNALFIFAPDGTSQVYHKRQLVPFAEDFPGEAYLSWLPYVGELSAHNTPGTVDGVYPTAALSIGPLICWESAFADLAYAQVRRGAQLLVVSTDDAWFGRTSEPYMHAQIAQLRAIEMGRYVIRAAATGISGIVAPNGAWTAREGMDRQGVVAGEVGPPLPTLFSRIGPTTVAAFIVLLYAALLLGARR